MGRNTAPAIGLAAFLLLKENPEAVIGLFPSDHVIGDEAHYRETLERGIEIAASGPNISGARAIRPNRAGNGIHRIYRSGEAHFRGEACCECAASPKKPDAKRAAEFVAAGNFFWNSGMFLWSARTLADALTEHLPKTAALLEEIAAAFGTRKFTDKFRKLYSKCENISVDYALLEPRSAKGEQAGNIVCLPADFGWNDLGSWTALHEHHNAKSRPVGRESDRELRHFYAQCERQLCSCAREVCRGGGRERSGGGGNARRVADYNPGSTRRTLARLLNILTRRRCTSWCSGYCVPRQRQAGSRNREMDA